MVGGQFHRLQQDNSVADRIYPSRCMFVGPLDVAIILVFILLQVFVAFTLTRTPTFYIAVIVIPTFLLANVCILGLFGPKPESDIGPEKVTF
jgi:hypothetical protein